MKLAAKVILVLLSIAMLSNNVVIDTIATTKPTEEVNLREYVIKTYSDDDADATKPAIEQATETEQPATEIETESEFEPETEPATEQATEHETEAETILGEKIIPESKEGIASKYSETTSSQSTKGTKVWTEAIWKCLRECSFTNKGEYEDILSYDWKLYVPEDDTTIFFKGEIPQVLNDSSAEEMMRQFIAGLGGSIKEELFVKVKSVTVLKNGTAFTAEDLALTLQVEKVETETETESATEQATELATEFTTEPETELATEPETEPAILGDEIIPESKEAIASKYSETTSSQSTKGTKVWTEAIWKCLRESSFTKGEYEDILSYDWKLYVTEDDTTIFFKGEIPQVLNDSSAEEMMRQFINGLGGYSIKEEISVKVKAVTVLKNGTVFKADNLDLTIQVEKVEDEAETEPETPGYVIIPESALKVAARNAERFGTRVKTTHVPTAKTSE